MKHLPLASILSFVVLVAFFGLACSFTINLPTYPQNQPPADQARTEKPPDPPPVNPVATITSPGQEPVVQVETEAPVPGSQGGNIVSEPPTNPPVDLPPAPDGMVAIPAGSFTMGCSPNDYFECPPRELPLHDVYLDGYYIDIYEVTNIQYAQCVGAGICEAPVFSMWGEKVHYNDSHYDDPQSTNYPVTNISWVDANNYCTWMGKTLPSEAQWEKAARGSSDVRVFPWGNTSPNCSLMNFYENVSVGTCVVAKEGTATSAVGSCPQGASPYGLMDMAGNVSEWILDDYFDDFYSFYEPGAWPPNPIAENAANDNDRITRGGNWNADAHLSSVSYRHVVGINGRSRVVGFRCVSNP